MVSGHGCESHHMETRHTTPSFSTGRPGGDGYRLDNYQHALLSEMRANTARSQLPDGVHSHHIITLHSSRQSHDGPAIRPSSLTQLSTPEHLPKVK
jgi:hypothetical protein